LDVPQHLDLEHLRARGPQPNEQLMTDNAAPTSQPEVTARQDLVEQLMSMSFPINASQRACIKTNNQGVDAAVNWIFEHSNDLDFNQPIQRPSHTPTQIQISEESVALLMSMGFSNEQATRALKATDNNLERASDWIFSHLDDPIESEKLPLPQQSGKGIYQLHSIVSHIGSSTQSGHYVAHIFKDGHWVFFNDEKVATSDQPPFEMAYLYIYRQID